MSTQASSARAVSDREAVIQSLEEQLRKISRADRPYEHATIAYRLGMAYAESTGTRTDGLRRALQHFDVAAAIFDPRFDPVEHARVLNAAGAVHRGLGNRKKAAELFEEAIELFRGKDRDAELAAALNNLGLARSEQGQFEGAVEAFDQAVDLFDTTTAEGRRGKIATLLNRGQAHAAQGVAEALEAALADYEQAEGDLDVEEAPYHFGLLQHSKGVAFSSLAGQKPEERERLLEEAIHAFKESLVVFTRVTMPYQFALAKHNLGLAYAGLGGTLNLRRALAAFEDTVSMLDTRVHGDAWRQAYTSMERVETELKAGFPTMRRVDHFVALLAAVKQEERYDLLRERVFHYMNLSEPQRTQFLTELQLSMGSLDLDRARRLMEEELGIVIELPTEKLEIALGAWYAAFQAMEDEETRTQASSALDYAIGDALGGPQRVMVRDYLEGLGWERPG